MRHKFSEERSLRPWNFSIVLVAGAVLFALLAAIPAAADAEQDVVARAGSLARSGKEHQPEAIALLLSTPCTGARRFGRACAVRHRAFLARQV